MNRLFEALRPFIRTVVQRAGVVLVIAVLLSVAGFFQARHLHIDTDFSNLVPDDYPSVQALKRLRETVGGENEVAVGIVSPSFEANKAFAEALIPRALKLKPPGSDETYLTRVEYRRDVEFLKDNALYFASNQELREVEQFLNEKIEEAKREANPFYVELEDEEETDTTAQELDAVYDRLVGTEYPISEDSTTMVLRFYTSCSRTDVGCIDNLYSDLDALVDSLGPTSYHPEMEVTLAGRLLRQRAEISAITNDVAGSFGTGVAAVILVVMLYFLYKSYRVRTGGAWNRRIFFAEVIRAPILGLVIAIPLLMSLTWTGGVAHLAIGELNLMTSTLGLVLFGLGIDFGIHFYARYTEERAAGQPIVDAAETTFVSTGQAIATGALTTAGALYVLVAADFKGFSEFGLIAGTGVLLALVAMTVVMPALLAVFERTSLLDLSTHVPLSENGSSSQRFSGARMIVIGSVAAVVVALIFAPGIQFEYDFGELEPEYELYEERSEVINRVDQTGGDRRNPAYVVVDSTSEVPEVVRAVREKMKDSSSTILAVESLQERFPLSDTAQQRKLQRIEQIRETLDSNKYLRNQSGEKLEQLRRAARTDSAIQLEQVPEDLRKQFTTRSGELGKFVIIYPSVGLSDGRKSIAFAKEVGTITTEDGETYHAASTPIVAADMLMLIQDEAPWMVLATFVIVALLMLINFRSVYWAGLALIPLVVGLLWMILLMEIFGLKLNFYNMVVLPAILGIGNDAGVHMVHRYREEGKGAIWAVLRSTGEHVTMGTLTTMIGFGGLLLSFHPGLVSMGTLAAAGLGTTLLAAVGFLPALLQWMEDRDAMPDVPEDQPAASSSPSTDGADQATPDVSTAVEEKGHPS